MTRALHPLLLLVALGACETEYEGDSPGECEDGADNDRDGLFDCFDADCAGAPSCDEDGGPPDTVDTPTDTEDTPTDTESGWDGVGDRPPGPHAAELRLVSAWEQDHRNPDTTYGPTCQNINDPDWAEFFDPPEYEDDGFYYVFYRVQDNGTAARGQDCSDGFPDRCVNNDLLYTLDGHVWTADLAPETITVDPIAAPRCNLTQATSSIVTDDGMTGELEIRVTLTTSPQCPPDFSVNNNCVITHRYALTWVRAE